MFYIWEIKFDLYILILWILINFLQFDSKKFLSLSGLTHQNSECGSFSLYKKKNLHLVIFSSRSGSIFYWYYYTLNKFFVFFGSQWIWFNYFLNWSSRNKYGFSLFISVFVLIELDIKLMEGLGHYQILLYGLLSL